MTVTYLQPSSFTFLFSLFIVAVVAVGGDMLLLEMCRTQQLAFVMV